MFPAAVTDVLLARSEMSRVVTGKVGERPGLAAHHYWMARSVPG